MMVLIFLTDVKDEGVAESVVSVVTSVDQELCVGDHRAAVPAAGSQNKSSYLKCLDPAAEHRHRRFQELITRKKKKVQTPKLKSKFG